jgi:hypothetical protein
VHDLTTLVHKTKRERELPRPLAGVATAAPAPDCQLEPIEPDARKPEWGAPTTTTTVSTGTAVAVRVPVPAGVCMGH